MSIRRQLQRIERELVCSSMERDLDRARARMLLDGPPVNHLPPELLAQRQREIREDAERNRWNEGRPTCTTRVCRCSKGVQCPAWLRSRTDVKEIARELWLSTMDMEPPNLPSPAAPSRWYRRPIVKRLAYGALPAWVYVMIFGLAAGVSVSVAGTVATFAMGAFIQYDMMTGTSMKARHMLARVVAIILCGLLIGLVL